jgi:hypothetical protein
MYLIKVDNFIFCDFFGQIHQNTKFQNIIVFTILLSRYKCFCFHCNSHILIDNRTDLQDMLCQSFKKFVY